MPAIFYTYPKLELMPQGAHLQDAKSQDSDCADTAQEVSADAVGKWLRNVCMKPRSRDFDSISEFMNKLDSKMAKAAAIQGNETGKAAVHFVSQIRGDNHDGLKLMQMLLQHRADVNAQTRRGHTPLIFAASRGHNEMVRWLLERRANPCVIVVTGGTAVSAGRYRLDQETLELLEAAEASHNGPWIDYRSNADAIQAHADVNADERRREVAEEEAQKDTEWYDRESTHLSKTLSSILGRCNSDAVHDLVTCLALSSQTKRERSVLELALQKAISDVLVHCNASLLDMFMLFDEEALRRAFHAIDYRDRRLIRLIFVSLLRTLQLSPSLLENITVAELIDRVSPHLAVAILRFKLSFDGEADRHAVEQLRQKLVRWSQLSSENIPEVSICEHCLTKKQGGAVATELLHRLRWACDMEVVTPMWTTMVEEIIMEASVKGQAGNLHDVMKDSDEFPPWVLQRLGATAAPKSAALNLMAAAGLPRNTSECDASAKPGVLQEDLPAQSLTLPKYALQCAYDWVPDDTSLLKVRLSLSAKFAKLEPHRRLIIGVDTEWGALGEIPSVVQLAIQGHAWVIDTAKPSRDTKDFFRWLFQQERALLLGFAFSSDAQKLASLMHDDMLSSAKQQVEVLDIQKVAIAAQANVSRGYNPGLKAVAERWLGLSLDKTEQCSDWDQRPLTQAQIHYAAADAAVMLDIAVAMGIDFSEQLPESMTTTGQQRSSKMRIQK